VADHAELDLTQIPKEEAAAVAADTGIVTAPYKVSEPYDPNKEREGDTR